MKSGPTNGVHYSARIVDLTHLPSQVDNEDGQYLSSAALKERAYFDWIPTVDYRGNITVHGSNTTLVPASNYCYLQARTQSHSDVASWLQAYPANFRLGAHDMSADYTHRTGHSDEDWVYVAGVGEEDPNASNGGQFDNWLKDGGTLILRYFNNEIGGVISGYSNQHTESNGATGWDHSYRIVNLQGKFTATRTDNNPSGYSTTIAEGATVNLLAGTLTDPTALLAPVGTTRTLMVNGTLNIYTANGNQDYVASTNAGGDVITMNIIVSSTGIVNVKTGADARVAGNVHILGGGHWNVEQGATMRLGNHAFLNEGIANIIGTIPSVATVKAYEGTALIATGT
jgi:hypothetical protein